jgi:hypothetical protein
MFNPFAVWKVTSSLNVETPVTLIPPPLTLIPSLAVIIPIESIFVTSS